MLHQVNLPHVSYFFFPLLTYHDFYFLLFTATVAALNAVDNYLLQKQSWFAPTTRGWNCNYSYGTRFDRSSEQNRRIMLYVVRDTRRGSTCNSDGIKREILLSLKQGFTAKISAAGVPRQIDRYRCAARLRASHPRNIRSLVIGP